MDGYYDALRVRYERSVTTLVRDGRFREASFVLADLLGRPEAAVDLLEEHEELALAARLAEGRQLPAAWVVRLWLPAGDLDRALRVARANGAFESALAELDRRGHAELADRMRIAWAASLAAAGCYARAVDALWPANRLRPTTLEWIDAGMELGGPDAVHLLLRRRELCPDRFTEDRAVLAAWLADSRPGGPHRRVLIAEALAGLSRTDETITLARDALRALLPEAGPSTRPALAGLRKMLRDPSLEADIPPSHLGATGPWSVILATSGTASRIAQDAALTPAGDLLVALGHTGLLTVDNDGQRRLKTDMPCTQVVVSQTGAQAIGILPLDGTGHVRLTRLDRVTGEARPWTEARIDAFASFTDGSTWFVAHDGAVMAIDLVDGGWRHLWRVTGVGSVRALHADDRTLRAIAHDGEGLDHWRWELPGPVLRSRTPQPTLARSWAMGGAGTVAMHAAQFQIRTLQGKVTVLECEPAGTPAVFRDCVVVPQIEPTGVRLLVLRSTTELGTLRLQGARGAIVRACQDHAVVWDDTGRVVAFDPHTGRVLHDCPL
ncbi:MAG: hypothetical protein ACI8PZ_001236 [Myxococcota bacterium]|jgi:hypothetical protein